MRYGHRINVKLLKVFLHGRFDFLHFANLLFDQLPIVLIQQRNYRNIEAGDAVSTIGVVFPLIIRPVSSFHVIKRTEAHILAG